MSTSTSGSCLCGTVSYSFTEDISVFQYCHCSRCRKFTGSAYAANLFVKPNNFKWLTGEHAIGRYQPPETKYLTTAFCKQCGSSLPWRNKPETLVIIPAGSLDHDPGTRPQWNIYCASKAEWEIEPSLLPSYDALPPKK